MREIKFRAWHIKQGKMYPAEELGHDQMTLMPDGRGFANISGRSTSLSQIDYGRTMIPEQFTGLKDKNGKEIYEGDILGPMANDHMPEYKGNWVVIYDGGAFFGQAPDGYEETWLPYWKPDTEIEVTGNIHENPELMGSITEKKGGS